MNEQNNGYKSDFGKSLEMWLDIPKHKRTGEWNVNWRLLGLRLVAYGFPVLSMNIIAGASTRMLVANMMAIMASVVHNYLTNAGNGKDDNDGRTLNLKD